MDDPGKVGPGSYNSHTFFHTSPKKIQNWSHQRSQREGVDQSHNWTQPSVGPGSYNATKHVDNKPRSMFLPRAGIAKSVNSRMNNGSIRDHFEEEEGDDGSKIVAPGPGQYNVPTSSFKTNSPKYQNLAYFGSNIPRFNEKMKGTDLGPGHYKVTNQMKGSKLAAVGSSTFKSPGRKSVFAGDGE